MSRNNFPKQFIDILGTGKTLIRQTYERFLSVCPKENIYIVTNEAYLDHVYSQIPELNKNQVLAEPQRRNTSPCIAYASMKIFSINPDANLIIAPSDHVITDEKKFHEAVLKGLDFTANNSSLLTIGIHPSRPDTGYGYIQFNGDESTEEFKISKVKTFTEKPNLEMAKFFLKSGEFLWNAGIFLWNAKTILKAFEDLMPDMYALFQEGKEMLNTPGEAEFGWSDLGTWKSLYEQLPHDTNGNAIVGPHVMVDNTKNCIVNMSNNKLAVIQGLENFIVVETDNVLLICPKDDEQGVRNLVNDVKLKKGEKYV